MQTDFHQPKNTRDEYLFNIANDDVRWAVGNAHAAPSQC